MSDLSITEEKLLARYKELCTRRDSTYLAKENLENQLADAVARMESARVEAAEIAKQIDEKYLTPEHFRLKKEIALIAGVLGKKGGPLAVKE